MATLLEAPGAAGVPAGLRTHWRDLGFVPSARLGWALELAASSQPDAIAVVDETERVTFRELRDRSDAVAAQLLAGGIGAGDVVSFSLPNAVATVAVAAAIWRIGAVSNPIVTLYREHEFSFILSQLRPAAVISSPDIRGRDLCFELDSALATAGVSPLLRLAVGGIPPAGWSAVTDGPVAPLPDSVVPGRPEAPCIVLYTSGTTSHPKAVLQSSAALMQEIASMQRRWGLTFRDRMMMASPLTHITGLLQGLLVPCLIGGRAILLDRWNAGACVAAIEAEGATYMAGATPFLRGILDAYDDAMPAAGPSLRQFCSGGASVPPELIEAADAIGISAYRCWGMTELPTATMAGERDSLEHRSRTDGPAAEGCEVVAVDAERRPLAAGEEGELRVRGPERMLGYMTAEHNDEALDADGWFYTGDVGSVDAGYVRITGRLKDIINRGGEKLSAREIEEVILQHERIADVAVIPIPDQRLGENVGAVIVTTGEVADDELLEFMRGRKLAVQKLPTGFRRLEELPRTAAGKVRKHDLIDNWKEEGR